MFVLRLTTPSSLQPISVHRNTIRLDSFFFFFLFFANRIKWKSHPGRYLENPFLLSRWFVDFVPRWFIDERTVEKVRFRVLGSTLKRKNIVIGEFIPLRFVSKFLCFKVGYFDVQNFRPCNTFDEHSCYLIETISIYIFFIHLAINSINWTE